MSKLILPKPEHSYVLVTTKAFSKTKEQIKIGEAAKEMAQRASKLDPFEEEIKFIQEVKKYPVLWSVQNRQVLRNRHMKEYIWQAIAKVMSWSVDECKRRWKSLRDRYSRERRTKIANDVLTPDANEVAGWALTSHLSFLSDHIKHRNSIQDQSQTETNPIIVEAEEEITADINSNGSDDRYALETTSNGGSNNEDFSFQNALSTTIKLEVVDNDVEQEQEMSDTEVTMKERDPEPEAKKPTRKRTYKSIKDQDDVEDAILKTLSDLRNENRVYVTAPPSKIAHIMKGGNGTPSSNLEFMDNDEMFCMSIAAEMRSLTEKQKSYAKMVIQKTMYDVKFGRSKELEKEES